MPKIDFTPDRKTGFQPEKTLGLDYESTLEKLYMEGSEDITPEEAELLALPGLIADEKPKPIEQRAKDTLAIASERSVSIQEAEDIEKTVSANKGANKLQQDIAETDRKNMMAIGPYDPSLWERIKRYFYEPRMPVVYDLPEGRVYRTPPIYREEQPFVTMGKLGLHYGTEALSGLGLYVPDVLTYAITGEPTLVSLVDKAIELEVTPKEYEAGESAKFITGLYTTGRLTTPLIAKLPARLTLRLMLGAGVQFGTRAGAEEIAKKITENKPVDWAKIHAESAWGVLWGTAEAGVGKLIKLKQYRDFIKARSEFKNFPRKLLMRIDEAIRAVQGGMPKKQAIKIYGKDMQRFSDLMRQNFGSGVKPPIPKALPGEVVVKPSAEITKVAPKIIEKPPKAPSVAITPEKPPIVPAEPTVAKAVKRELPAEIRKRFVEKLPDVENFTSGQEWQIEALYQLGYEVEPVGKKDISTNAPANVVKSLGYVGDLIDKGKTSDAILALHQMMSEKYKPAPAEPTVVKPAKVKGMRPGKIDVTGFVKTAKGIMNIIEPTKVAAMKVGKKPVATVIRGIHETDVGRVEFEQKKIDLLDKSILDTEKQLSKFSDKDLENLMLARGKSVSPEAKLLQKEAIAALPKALQGPEFRQAIQEVADFNLEYLRKVFGPDIKKFKDYFYGIYKDPKKVSKFLDHWQSTERYLKEKKFPTYADAKAWGLEIKNPNPITNLRSEYVAISHISGMMWMKNELMRNGEGKYIWTKEQAPTRADKVYDWTFNDVRLDPDLAKLVNNLIAKNKITGVPVLNTIRQCNNFIRTVKFIGSAFHLMSIAKQSVADSGYLGFLQPQKWIGFHRRPGSFVPIGIHKESAALGVTLGFKKNDPIFQTPFYKRYLANGGGHRYAVESETARVFTQAIDSINKQAAIGIKTGMLPLQIPKAFVNWMFQSYIPKVKYAKTLSWYNKQSRKLGRELTDAEFQEIIKEGQNFYGMMNERLFGRSGTVTTLMRFYFMSPGYAEGNYRSMTKGATQWGFGEEGFKASRSRSNIINSWLLTGILATIGTIVLAKKWPKKPEQLEDIRDLFKIDTGEVDNKGKAIMIDLMTYDKDYWNVAFNTLRLRPDIALDKSVKRIGGMKAPMAEVTHDVVGIAMGKVLIDWKKDEVFYPTDDFIVKMTKLINYEVRRIEPISISVYKQSRRREIDRVTAAIESLAGLRPAYTEADRREKDYLRRMYSLRGQREELSWLIGKSKDPLGLVKKYNQTVNEILDSSIVSEEMKEEWSPKLLIDEMKVFTWKRFPPEKMTVAQLKIARGARTYKADQKKYPNQPENWRPHKGYEERIKKINVELSKRRQ